MEFEEAVREPRAASLLSDRMLIDRFLPRFQFSERHAVAIAAPAGRVRAALKARDPLSEDPLVRALLTLRRAPDRVLRRGEPTPSFGLQSFTQLADTSDEIVLGLIGRFWRPDGGLCTIPDADAFRAFDTPGVAKLVMNFALHPNGHGTRLTTETRIFCSDARSLALFAPYWLVIRLPSGFIRRRYLGAVKREAETGK